MLNLGDEVKDIVSGYKGVITSRTEFISGCIRYGVQPKANMKEMTLPEAISFDENQLELTKAKRVVRAKGDDGGPERKIQHRY